MSVLAVDIGSSACKAVAFATAGAVLASHTCSYRPQFPRPGHAEMPPQTLWDAVLQCCSETARRCEQPVQAICLSSHAESFVPINSSGVAIGPVILNQDGRAISQAERIAREVGTRELFELTGLISHPMYPAAKLLWLRKHSPELFKTGVQFVTVVGYILSRLGLEPIADYSLASRYLAFDVRRRCWSPAILALIGTPEESLPRTAPAGTVVGSLNAASAAELGLPAGTKVVLGGHDQPCSALGLGATESGRVTDSMGTYECLLATSDEPDHSDEAFAASLNSYCHILPGKFATIAYFPSGIMLEWYRKLLESDSRPRPTYAELESGTTSHPSGLFITPNLIGTCNPDFNMHARSVIFGLHTGTRREDIYQGILEGIACEFSRMAAFLAKAAGGFDDVYVTGGGAESKLGLKLRSTISGKRLHVMSSSDAVCVGGAILAGVAIGEYRDVAEGVQCLVREAQIVAPEFSLRDEYERHFRTYERMYAALAPFQTATSDQQSQERA